MRTIDYSPLYRSVVGFDRLASLLDAAAKGADAAGYPPYNIESVGDDAYRIELAVAGFASDELELNARENVLTVTGRKAANDDGAKRFLHRGLAARNFERRFQMADYVVVTGAALANGLLTIDLERQLPESLKPRRIEIATAAPHATAIEGQAQAA